jgi:hypothetical protein
MNRTAILIATLLPLTAFAQKPDFSGNWKLNVEKSDFGPLPPPDSSMEVITQTADQIKESITEKGGMFDGQREEVFALDGSESVNKVGGQDLKSTIKFDGATMLFSGKTTYQEADVTVEAKWTLSPDGKTLTVATHYSSSLGEADTTRVFEKQGAMEAKAGTGPATPAPVAAAQADMGAHPNFSGTWKLNVDKSDFGPIPAPDSRVDKIDHKEPAVKVSVAQKGGQGDFSGDLNYFTDGKPSTNTMGPGEIKSTGKWDGNALTFDSTLNMQGTDIGVKSRWELSADGKVMTQTAHINSPMGELDMKSVFDKQPD